VPAVPKLAQNGGYMPENRLRNHIPLSAPATREPCTGDEADLRVLLGIDFSRQWGAYGSHRIYDNLVPCEIIMADITDTTPNKRVPGIP